MAFTKPSIPSGTRDFSPLEMVRRNYIFSSIREIFQLFGYLPIETPAMENLSTLLGKYGEEGDKLLFRILNSGDFLSKSDKDAIANEDSLKLSNSISEKGLRYDLTVPFARYVVQHRNEINFPFKRYQIQPVWRADRPQKGRYREFYQCDVDTIGSDSLLNEVELIKIIDLVFTRLKIRANIKLNNRKILAGIAEIIGQSDKITEITIALDKIEKIGREKVIAELTERGISKDSVDRLGPLFNMSGSNEEKIIFLEKYLGSSAVGLEGIEELKSIFHFLIAFGISSQLEIDLTLARGLNYYTGCIIEVKAMDAEIGSICGGGRYDNLTGIFGMEGVSGVGVSFGADRIYDVMLHLNLFPVEAESGTQIIFVNFGHNEAFAVLPVISKLRSMGIAVELYPDSAKMKKQMSFANINNIPFVALAGEDELSKGQLTLKNMKSGEQETLDFEELYKKFGA
ncbi:MAG: histidine--tRNA ligase [Bacteroidales bacterium]|nr:histidine--tRNA ligase [Bacteroidales bacterium]MCB8999257.1 histidine--tRNA ligase [Bacteroidales bacterium]MCB9013075.1 histidine--tRNA ligase [Bacteroidales bacterium]